ncbi:MAG: hypothetical protein R6V75_07890 [Bacteroidales bacterium]
MKLIRLTLICLMALLGSCDPEEPLPDNGTDGTDTWKGAVEFDFEVPQTGVPARGVRRVLLHIAQTADSLNRKDFYSSANVSDHKQKYTFHLPPGRYYYQAGVTCTCGGDTCLYGGFPGGQLSVWYTSGYVDVELGKTTNQKIKFQ